MRAARADYFKEAEARTTPDKEFKFRQGDIVTCVEKESGSYSNYGGNPEFFFHPGMRGVVVSFPPKVSVRKVAAPPKYDTYPFFINVDFFSSETGKMERVALNFCNTVLVERVLDASDKSSRRRDKPGADTDG